MSLVAIAVGVFLFVFLVIFTLLINPPNSWVQKFTDREEKKRRN
jgi:hypothetical protein